MKDYLGKGVYRRLWRATENPATTEDYISRRDYPVLLRGGATISEKRVSRAFFGRGRRPYKRWIGVSCRPAKEEVRPFRHLLHASGFWSMRSMTGIKRWKRPRLDKYRSGSCWSVLSVVSSEYFLRGFRLSFL